MERPILFSGPMVRAILDGRKTQTRRIVKSSIADFHTMDFMHLENDGSPEIAWFESGRVQEWVKCPYGSVGDRLWVREAWCHAADDDDRMKYNADGNLDSSCCHYRADGYEVRHVDGAETKGGLPKSPWVPSIHMPRCASRITLEITGIRVERLNAISEEDALSEGISFKCFDANCNVIRHAVWPKEPTLSDRANAKDTFRELWESINGPGSWSANPWVWVIEFKRLHPDNLTARADSPTLDA